MPLINAAFTQDVLKLCPTRLDSGRPPNCLTKSTKMRGAEYFRLDAASIAPIVSRRSGLDWATTCLGTSRNRNRCSLWASSVERGARPFIRIPQWKGLGGSFLCHGVPHVKGISEAQLIRDNPLSASVAHRARLGSQSFLASGRV